MSDTDFRTNPTASTTTLEVLNQLVRIHVQPENITIYVYSSTFCPSNGVRIYIGFCKKSLDLFLADGLRNINHLCCVLHKTTILSFRCLVGAETTPLGGVQITGLEVRLTADKRAGNPAHVRQSCKEGGSVKKLAYTTSATDPIPSCKSVHDLGCQHVRTQTGGNLEVSLAIVVTLKLVLEIASQLLQRDAEQILNQVTSQTDTLVWLVVLVVGFRVGDCHV